MVALSALVVCASTKVTAAVGVGAAAPPSLATPRVEVAEPSPGAIVDFRNELPQTYRLERVRLWVDGRLRYDGGRAFAAPVATGQHVVSVAAQYRMHDPVLSYTRGYSIELRSAEHFQSSAARPVVARAIESGGVTTPVERRAQIRWRR